jgi:hypothetical protein
VIEEGCRRAVGGFGDLFDGRRVVALLVEEQAPDDRPGSVKGWNRST